MSDFTGVIMIAALLGTLVLMGYLADNNDAKRICAEARYKLIVLENCTGIKS